jgi:hypothetical protein
MSSTAKARVVVASTGVVNVHVSAQTMYNFDETQRLTKEIVGRLGHPGCCSGFQLNFQLEENEFSAG